jgi:zinc protease
VYSRQRSLRSSHSEGFRWVATSGRTGRSPLWSLVLWLCIYFFTWESANAAAADSAPAGGAPSVVRYRLANGLRVVLNPEPSLGTVAICSSHALGSRHDPAGQAGAAWLLQQLSSAGTSRTSAAKELELGGARVLSALDTDESSSLVVVPLQLLAPALRFQAARFEPGSLTARASEVRTAALAHHQGGVASAQQRAEARVRELVFQSHWPYAHPIEGTEASIAAIAIEEVERLHAARMRPDSAVLTLAGNFEEPTARQLIDETFGPITAMPLLGATEGALTRVPRQTSERFNASVDDRLRTPVALYAWPIPGQSSPAHLAFEVLAEMLSERGGADWRAKLLAAGVATSVDSWTLQHWGPAALVVRIGVDARSSVDKARSALELTWARWARSGPSEAELSEAKGRLREARTRELAAAETRARLLARHEWLEGDARTAFAGPARYEAVTRRQIQRAVARYLGETQRTAVEVYPRGWPQDPLPAVVERQHIVKAGETLTGIAARYHSDVDAIAVANKIRSNRFIFPGQRLTVPVETAKAKEKSKRTYVVKKGDSFSVIAKRHGVSTAALAYANGRTARQRIRIGEILTIPKPDRPASSSASKAPDQRRHRVARGETLLGLAKRYGVPAADIAKANGRRPQQAIVAGEWLIIPKAKPRERP